MSVTNCCLFNLLLLLVCPPSAVEHLERIVLRVGAPGMREIHVAPRALVWRQEQNIHYGRAHARTRVYRPEERIDSKAAVVRA